MEVENETSAAPVTVAGDGKDKEDSDAQKDDTEEKTPGRLFVHVTVRALL